jgi:hypothetical protein
MEFVLKLNEHEAQVVLNALIKEPYGEVVDVINKIQQQAVEQRQNNEQS